MTLPVTLVDLPEQLLAGERANGMRARPYQAHVALEHVEQLRQLVDASAAKNAPDTGNPVVIPAGRAHAITVGALDSHRAQLEDRKQLVAPPDAFLLEQNRAAVFEFDGERCNQKYRQGKSQGQD